VTSADEARKLLGHAVEVVLSTDGTAKDGPVIARGVLLSFSAMGETVLSGEDGDVHYCWPALDIRRAG
jgi:hypothetical protein